MQEVNLSRLADGFERALKEFPEERRRILDEMGQEALEALRARIGGAGKVRSWQGKHLGSLGGYAAVRPAAKTWQETKRGKRYAVGAVTNAIESGHRVRRPAEGSGRKSRAKLRYVPAKRFYRDTAADAEAIAGRRAVELAEAMKKLLEE